MIRWYGKMLRYFVLFSIKSDYQIKNDKIDKIREMQECFEKTFRQNLFISYLFSKNNNNLFYY